MKLARTLRLVGALGVLVGALVHGYLWNEEYKDIPSVEGPELFKVGNLFLANLVTGVIIALAIVVLKHRKADLAVVAGIGWSISALLGFYVSRNGGLFGFEEMLWQPAPEAAISVAAEAVALVALAGALAAARVPDRRSLAHMR